jgi:hypothetical protein
MKAIIYILTWLFNRALLALICYVTYWLLLSDLVGIQIQYLNWLGIVIISHGLLPVSILKPESSLRPEDKKIGSLLERYRNGKQGD